MHPAGRQVLVAALGFSGALGVGAAAYHSARVELPRAMQAGIARVLGVSVSRVSLGEVRLGLSGLVLKDVSAGAFTARSLRYLPDRWALLGRGLSGTVDLEDIRVTTPVPSLDSIQVAHAEVQLSALGARLHAREITFTLGASVLPLLTQPLQLDEMGVELARSDGRLSPRRIAFSGLHIDRTGSLAGGARISAQGVDVRAAGPGLRVSARATVDQIDASIELEHRRVQANGSDTAVLQRLGIEHLDASLSGQLELHLMRNPDAVSSFEGSVAVDRGALSAPRLAPTPVAIDGMHLSAHGTRTRSSVAIEQLQLGLGALRLEADGAIAGLEQGAAKLSMRLRLPRSSCAAVLGSLPSALHPALDGMALDGELGGSFSLAMPLSAPSELSLDSTLDLGCLVASEPPLADAGRLRDEAPTLIGARDENGAPRRIELGPNNPAYRRLAQIPKLVAATFVEAEDGRFYQHRGLDLSQIRRALAHDLEVGAPGRGGSTITQQVAKNLFLSGERTLGRKLEESVLAWRLEQRLDKRRILELYLNLVELGPGIYGIAEGARHWFKKDVAALTPKEAAALAALLPAPRRGMDEAFDRRLAQLQARLR